MDRFTQSDAKQQLQLRLAIIEETVLLDGEQSDLKLYQPAVSGTRSRGAHIIATGVR